MLKNKNKQVGKVTVNCMGPPKIAEPIPEETNDDIVGADEVVVGGNDTNNEEVEEEQFGGLASLVEDEGGADDAEGGGQQEQEEGSVGDGGDNYGDDDDDSDSIRTEELLAMDTTYLSMNEFLRSTVTGRNITDVLEDLLSVVQKYVSPSK